MSGEILKSQDLVEQAVERSRRKTKKSKLISGRSIGTVNEPENEYYVVGKGQAGVQLRRFTNNHNCSETRIVDRMDDPDDVFSVPLACWEFGRMKAIVESAIDLIEDDINSGEVRKNVGEVATIIADASILKKH